MTVAGGVGHGLPWWLPDEYLTVSETLALGDIELNLAGGACPVCMTENSPPSWGVLDPAHVVTKGMGGRPKGAGPTVRICRRHHDLQHFSADGVRRTMAIRREDGAVCWLERMADGPGDYLIEARVLGRVRSWQ